MKRGRAIRWLILGTMLAGGVYLLWAVKNHGFSARGEPSRIEGWLARHIRSIATPAHARNLKNPYSQTQEILASARHHFVEHCSACHALDGSGNTTFGRNMYPRVPDLRNRQTQGLTDGELYYVISNGVRFTGMPAFGGEDSPEDIWHLVLFLRRLPNLTPEELQAMEKLATGTTSDQPTGEPGHSPPPGTTPHKH